MSSATTATAIIPAVAEAVEKPPRKFPPPCWTQEETLVLIDTYRERWYALRRGYLRTADWDAVAITIASRFPDISPPKTSAQCRHKMEKLRQRYRAEKQRSLAYPYPAGRFISTWFFFDYMDAMENGTAPPSATVAAAAATESGENPSNSASGSLLKTFLDQSILKLKLKSKNNADSNPDFSLDNGIKAKNSKTKISNEHYSYIEMGDNKEEQELEQEEDHTGFGSQIHVPGRFPIPPLKFKPKNSGKYFAEFSPNYDINGGFQMRSSANQEMPHQGLRVKRLGKFDRKMDTRFDGCNEEFWMKMSAAAEAHQGFRGRYEGNVNPSMAPNVLKRGRDPVEEMVASIKLLGEGLVRMEGAKMEMAREMETARMEMELKRNEMILESQRQIVDAFVKGLLEFKKNKKAKVATVSSDS